MLDFKDFVPQMVSGPALFKPAQHEALAEALKSANVWIHANKVQVINIETVVLPNIWSRWEEGSADTSLGTSGDSPSHWHQFIRVWFRT